MAGARGGGPGSGPAYRRGGGPGPGQRARVAAANAASRLLLRLVDQVADSEARIEDVAALFSSRPFTWDFTGGAGGTRIDAALQRLCVLSVLTRADVERMRGKLHGASP